MMNNQDYWRERMLYAKKQRLVSAAEYEDAMRSRLKDLEHEFEKEAAKFTQRYIDENNTTLEQASKVLNGVNNHRWSMSLEEFEAKAKAGGYERILNTEYYRSRIYRLQQLHDQMAELAKKYSVNEEIRMRNELIKTYDDTYLQDNYVKDVLEGQLTVKLNRFNEQQLADIVYKPWNGSSFSERIWNNYTKVLPDVLTDTMLRATVMGYSTNRVVKDIRDRFYDVSTNNIHRLVVTEMGHAAEEATAKFYEDSDIDQYQYLATLETHTCDQCRHLDDKIFNTKDRVEGKNYPLMHPYCRCTTVPYIEGLPDIESLWARDPETGKGNWVKNMSFAEWKKVVTDEATRKRYNFLAENYGKHGFPKSFKEFKKVMYNNGTENRALKAYIKAREKGTVEPVVSFYDYVDAMKQLDKEVIGIKTVDNQDVISYSNHLIDRIFGVREDPNGHKRIGVSIDEIKEMLKQGKTKYLKISTKYITNEGYVVLNKQGNLVTVVPRKETKR